MSDLTEQDTSKLFNDVSKAMQDDDGSKLSELLAQETPHEEEQPTEELPETPEEEEQPEDTSGEEEDGPSDEEGKEPDKKTGKTEEEEEPEELSEEAKTLKELQEQLEATKKENQSLRSQAGRVPHIQRRLAELDKKLETIKASPSSQTSAKIKPKLDKLLEGVKDTDPALAEAIAEALGTAIDGLDEESRTRETETLTLLREQEQLEYQEEQVSKLTSMYPNASQVFASPHWAAWKKTQPEHILKLAGSDSADAVAMAFELYTKDMQAKYPELVSKETPSGNGAKQPTQEDVAKATKLEQERLRKQKSEANLKSGKAGTRVSEPKDPEALFKMFSEQIAKEMKGT